MLGQVQCFPSGSTCVGNKSDNSQLAFKTFPFQRPHNPKELLLNVDPLPHLLMHNFISKQYFVISHAHMPKNTGVTTYSVTATNCVIVFTEVSTD